MVTGFGEEDLTVRVASPVQSDQPIDRLAPQTMLVGELSGPHLKRLAQVDEGVVQVEKREWLHGNPP